MKLQATLYLAMILLLMTVSAAAQSSAGEPPVNLFGPDQAAFNQAMQQVYFAHDDHEAPSDQHVIKANADWLKAHPNVKFYIDGYASITGDLIYNLVLSQRRAEWVKQALIKAGVPESQIVLATGWGLLYPVCPGMSEDCREKSRRVEFEYSPS